MDRFIGTTLLLLTACLAAPTVAAIAQAAVPALGTLLLVLAMLRLALRPTRRR